MIKRAMTTLVLLGAFGIAAATPQKNDSAKLDTGRIEQLDVAFRTNVLAEDEVIATAAVEHLDLTEDATRLYCRVTLDVASRARALEGTATIAMPAASQSGAAQAG